MSPTYPIRVNPYLIGAPIRSLALLALVALAPPPTVAAQSSVSSTRATPPQALASGEVQALEEKLAVDSEDLSARRQLLEHYSREQFHSKEAREGRQKHVLWMIEYRPEEELRGPSL